MLTCLGAFFYRPCLPSHFLQPQIFFPSSNSHRWSGIGRLAARTNLIATDFLLRFFSVLFPCYLDVNRIAASSPLPIDQPPDNRIRVFVAREKESLQLGLPGREERVGVKPWNDKLQTSRLYTEQRGHSFMSDQYGGRVQ
ncbi:hypothetical protein L1887_25747 [Cichorium endivia]|nr:hypothetical protein L1887_25747 [Cichorium endivia]